MGMTSRVDLAATFRLVLGTVLCFAAAGFDIAVGGRAIDEIVASERLRIGIDIPYGVMEYYDSDGNPAGIDVDIGREIAIDLDVSPHWVTMPFSKLFDAVQSGTVDLVISAVTITPERQKKMLFSAPYLDVALYIGVASGNRSIRSANDLKGRTVGVLKGTTGEDFANKSNVVDAGLVRVFDNNDRRMAALIGGEIDAAIVHFLKSDTQGVKVVGNPLRQSYYGVVSALENRLLMDRINRTLRRMKRSGRLRAITKKHGG